jgi:muramoyltetrapeptide carboxypeptidase
LKIPPNLKPKDKIAIICSARAVEENELKPALKILEQWDLVPVLGNTIGLRHHQFGGTDQQRAQDFQEAINNPEIKAIWCARGGYGTARILDRIDFSPLLENPKWIIGYSDVTALHLQLQQLGLVSLHAQMPLDIEKKSEKTIESLRQSLFEKPFDISYVSSFSSRNGECEGELIGGNLSVLYSVLGTHPISDFHQKILILEDLDEYLYHIDRMMLNLFRTGLLKQISGLIIGGMTDMNDNSISFGQTANEIIDSYAKRLNIPVAYNAPFGHVSDNLAMCLGKKVTLRIVENKVSITY